MLEIKKNTTHPSKNIKNLCSKEVVFITKTEITPSKTLFPEKLKKINNLLKKTNLLP